MNPINLPPPRRFIVTEAEDTFVPLLLEVTGIEDPAYIVGLQSPWLGISLDEVEKQLYDGAYGADTFALKAMIEDAKQGITFFEKDDDEPPTT